MTFRAFPTPLIRLRDLPAGGPSGHSIQTDSLLLKAGLSAWENEGGAPVPPASDIEGKELSPARRSGSITPGTILIEEDTPHPQCFHLEDGSYSNAWRSVIYNLTYRELEKELASTGWTFFYIANSIKVTAFGFDRAKMVHAALRRVIASVIQQGCNCLEIDDVTMHSFLGMPYARVFARPRHIQKGLVFSGQPHPREIADFVPAARKKKWVF